MAYLLGIDIGTSGTKTALFTENGTLIADETVGYPLYQPHNGWAEQEPADWWNAVCRGIRSVLSKSGVSPAEIKSAGLSGQMHGLVMLGRDAKVLRRSIIWCDQRTAAECEQMKALAGEKRIIEITANPPMTGFTAAKILWVKNNEPEIYEKCAHILLPKDYIRYMLTGEFATEVSDASGMQLMNVGKREWSEELLTVFDIDRALLPQMYESPEITGQISAHAAALTGLSQGTYVVGGAGDNAAAAVGTGIVSQGSAFNTIGSSAVIYAVTDELKTDLSGRIHSLCASVPGKWTLMSCTQGAGISLHWLRDTCCRSETEHAELQGTDAYILMDKLAEKSPAGANKLLYLPYLMGERSPHPDSDCRGVFFGLSAVHTSGDLIRSVLEGVGFSQRECLDVFREMGVNVDNITLCGGGAKSPLWKAILSDMYSCGVKTLVSDHGAALGAALLAGVGSGVYANVEEASLVAVRYTDPISPDSRNSQIYDKLYPVYKSLYPDLYKDFKKLAAVTL